MNFYMVSIVIVLFLFYFSVDPIQVYKLGSETGEIFLSYMSIQHTEQTGTFYKLCRSLQLHLYSGLQLP